MSIFDELNQEGIDALQPGNRTFSSINFPETSGNALDAIAFSGTENQFPEFQSLFEDSPFGDNSIFAQEKPSEIWKGFVDFYAALERFGTASLTDISIEEGIVLEEVILNGKITKTKFDYKKVIDSNKPFQSHWELGDNAYVGYIYVNKKIDYLSDSKLFFSYDGIQEYAPYDSAFSIYKPYNTDRNVGSLNNPNIEYLKNNAALQIQGLSFKGMLIILEGMENGTADRKYIEAGYKLLAKTVEQFTLSSRSPNDYIKILAHLNDKVVEHINTRILEQLWSRFIQEDNLVNIYEVILLNILRGLSNKPSFNADTFLRKLLSNSIKGETEFERLYNKMNDWGGPNNFSRLILRLLLIWKDSDFIRFQNSVFQNFDRPVNLAYKQEKILGFRVDDYDFNFDKNSNIIAEIEPGVQIPKNPISSIILDNLLQKEERYHPFFPITLTELDETENGDLKLETTVPVPAFYLKAFDDKGAWENFEKGVWLAVDIITTATGVGNLLKLRHVLKLKNAFVYLKLAFGIVEVASGIVGIALNFVDKCKDKDFCNKLRQYLFWFEICTLGADALTTRILRKQSQEAKTALETYRNKVKIGKEQKELNILEKHFDEIAEKARNTGKFTVKNDGVITVSKFNKIAKRIKQEHNVDMFLVDKNNRRWVELFKKWQRNPLEALWADQPLSSKNYPGIQLDGPAIYLFDGRARKVINGIPEDVVYEVTSYTVQHELFHMKMWLTIKERFPKDFILKFHQLPDEVHEAFVLSEFVKTKQFTKWNEIDILDDLDAYNLNFNQSKILKDFETFNLEDHLKTL